MSRDPGRVLLEVGRCPEVMGNERTQMIRVISRVRDDMADALQSLDQAARLTSESAAWQRCNREKVVAVSPHGSVSRRRAW